MQHSLALRHTSFPSPLFFKDRTTAPNKPRQSIFTEQCVSSGGGETPAEGFSLVAAACRPPPCCLLPPGTSGFTDRLVPAGPGRGLWDFAVFILDLVKCYAQQQMSCIYQRHYFLACSIKSAPPPPLALSHSPYKYTMSLWFPPKLHNIK